MTNNARVIYPEYELDHEPLDPEIACPTVIAANSDGPTWVQENLRFFGNKYPPDINNDQRTVRLSGPDGCAAFNHFSPEKVGVNPWQNDWFVRMHQRECIGLFLPSDTFDDRTKVIDAAEIALAALEHGPVLDKVRKALNCVYDTNGVKVLLHHTGPLTRNWAVEMSLDGGLRGAFSISADASKRRKPFTFLVQSSGEVISRDNFGNSLFSFDGHGNDFNSVLIAYYKFLLDRNPECFSLAPYIFG